MRFSRVTAWRQSQRRGRIATIARIALFACLLAAIPLSGAQTATSAGSAAKLAFTAEPASANGGSAFGTQAEVTIEDSSGHAVTDDASTVAIAIAPSTPTAGGPGMLSGCTQTESSGVVSFSGCTIDKQGTGYELIATDGTLTAATSTAFDVMVGAATQVVFTQEPNDIVAGQDFSPAPELALEDAGGNTVDTSTENLGLGLLTGPGALACTGGETSAPKDKAPGYELTASHGSATFSSCTVDEASPTNDELIGVASDGSTTFSTTSSDFAVNAGTPTQLVFSTNPTGAQAASAFGVQPVVSVEDGAGDLVTGTNGTVTLSISPGTGDSGATLTCPPAATSDGVAMFSGCGIDKIGTGYTLSATLSGTALTGTSSPFIVSASGAAQLAFKMDPGDGTGGAPLATAPVVTVSDSGGNPVSGSVSLALTGGTSGATLTCPQNPAPAGTGSVTFSGCSVDLAGTGYHLVATDPAATSVPAVTSGAFDVMTGAAAQVVFGTSPAGAKGGIPFTTQPIVSVEDLGGNPVPGSSITLGISAATGTPGASLTCTGGNTKVATSGTTSFSGCSIDKAGTGYTLSAHSVSRVGTSTPFPVATGSAAGLAFSVEPSGGIVSSPFGAQPQVSLVDAGGNPVGGAGVSVTLVPSDGSLACLANPALTDANGVAAFSDCRLASTGGFTLQASAPGLGSTTSTSFSVANGSPLEVAPVGVPVAQTYAGAQIGNNPTSVTDEVNSATGALQLGFGDLKVAAIGEALNLGRNYNSLDQTGGAFGAGWSSILDAGVHVAANGLTAVVRNTDGQQIVFASNGHGGWNPPAGARATLSCQGLLCTVVRFDGVSFQSIGGQIQDYLSPQGIGFHFVYAGGRLVEITNSDAGLESGVQAGLGAEVGTLGWATETASPAVALNAVDSADNTHLWAAGNNCTIEFTGNGGTTWAKDPNVTGCPAGTSLTGIFVQGGAGPAWAVGTGGTILVCAGQCNTATAGWTALTASSGGLPPTTLNFTSVWAADPNHVFAVGTSTSGAGAIWACSANCDATSASAPPGPPKPPAPPAPKGPAAWANVTPSGLGSTALNGIGGQGPGLVLAVGSNGTIFTCTAPNPNCATTASAWAPLTKGTGGSVPSSSVTFNSVWAADPNHVYAVGSAGGSGVIWSCSANCNQTVTGTANVPSPPGNPPGPPAPPPPPAKAAWADITPPGLGSTTLESVTGEGPDHAWAVGTGGQIWYCPGNCATEPTGWVSLSPPGPTSSTLLGVTSSDPKHVWAVGANGAIVATNAGSPTLDALDHAITALGVSLNPTLWSDGNDLLTGQPNQVLDGIVQAIQQLASLPTPPPPPPGPPAPPPAAPSYPAWVVTSLVGLEQELRALDANAISENLANPLNSKSLADAQTQFAAADAALAAGQYNQAATAYRQAWQQALAAQGSGQGSHKPFAVFVTENAAGLVTQISSATRTVGYTYTGGALTGFTDADGNAWTYGYAGSGALDQVTDPTGHTRLAVTYSGGRVQSAMALGSQRHFSDTYSWNPAAQTSTRTALVQLAFGAAATTGAYVDQYKNNVLLSEQLPDGATTDYSYDNELQLIESQDPLGRITKLSYSPAGDLIGEVSPYKANATATTALSYNAGHQIVSSTDANNNTTTYAYVAGNLVQMTPPGPAAGATHYVYNLLGEQLETDTPTGIETFAYDDAGDQTGFQKLDLHRNPLNGLGPVFSYDESGQKLVSTDARGHTAGGLNAAYQSVDAYDGDENLLSTSNPGPQVTATVYSPAGDVSQVTSPNGQTTQYSWDEATLTFTATNAAGTTTSVYDPSGELLQQTDPGGRTTSYTYDPSGNELSITDPTNVTTTYSHDLEGNVTGATDTAGHSSSFTFDPQNRPLASTVNGVTTTTGYDPAGNVTSKLDAAGRLTTWAFNSHELPSSVTTADGTTAYTYDLSDNLIATKDGNNHTVSYTVNGAGERTQMNVNGQLTNYAYDAAGNLVNTTDPDGRVTHYTLNPEDLRTQIDFSQPGHTAISVAQDFNPEGQRTQMTDPSTGTHTFTYDSGGNLTKADNAPGNTFSYDYSVPGQMTETYPDGSQAVYTFDDGHNVMSVSSGDVHASYLRNTARQVTGIAYSNGVLQTEAYNEAGQQISNSLTCGGTSELTTSASFGPAGDPLSSATTVGGVTTLSSYGYDDAGRVAAQSATTGPATTPTAPDPSCTSGTASQTGSPQQDDGSGTVPGSSAPTDANQPSGPVGASPGSGTSANPIGWDAVGNETSGGGTSIGYNAADEVTSESGGVNPASYTYDNAGNITSRTVGGVLTTYAYNAADQLVTVTTGATTVSYVYDGDGNRVKTTVANGATTSVTNLSWDPSGAIPLLALERDGGGNLIARFIYGVGPVAMQTPATTVYLHTDQQGDVTALSGPTGAVLETYTYDAFGNVTATQVGAASVPAEPLLFQGQYLDEATGLYDLRARNYDPSTGRFTQRDPLTAPIGIPEVSPYVFANDEPTVSGDPSGLADVGTLAASAFQGHSSETDNAIGDARYGTIALKAGIKGVKKVSDFFSKTAADAEPALADAGEGIAEAGPELGKTAGLVGEDIGPELADAADEGGAGLGESAGKVLGVAGIGLGVYLTVEDCMHGTVSQCVGDTIGLALGVACTVATEGIGAVACGIGAAAVGFVIAQYGPEIAEGAVDLANYTAAAGLEAITALNAGFETAGTVLKGAFANAAQQTLAGLNELATGITSTFDTAYGAASTDFNKAASAISSGFNDAISTLEQAGYSALEFAKTLKNQFSEGLSDCLEQLNDLGYDIDGIGKAIGGAFAQTAAGAAALFRQLGYGVNQITSALENAYGQAAAGAAAILKGLNYGIDQISGALAGVYGELAADTAQILQGLNYGLSQIGDEMKSLYKLGDQAATVIFQGLNYGLDEIAGTLTSVYDDVSADVATVFDNLGISPSQIASTLQSVFSSTPAEVAMILQNTLHLSIDKVATALETAYGETADAISGVLKGIGDDVTQISNMLSDVFKETTSQIEDALSNAGFNNATIQTIGGAFKSFGADLSSVGDEIASWF